MYAVTVSAHCAISIFNKVRAGMITSTVSCVTFNDQPSRITSGDSML
jgi:hypothetical protein